LFVAAVVLFFNFKQKLMRYLIIIRRKFLGNPYTSDNLMIRIKNGIQSNKLTGPASYTSSFHNFANNVTPSV